MANLVVNDSRNGNCATKRSATDSFQSEQSQICGTSAKKPRLLRRFDYETNRFSGCSTGETCSPANTSTEAEREDVALMVRGQTITPNVPPTSFMGAVPGESQGDHLGGNASNNHPSLDSCCFGMLVFEDISFRENAFDSKATEKITLEPMGTATDIKNLCSLQYGGLLDDRHSLVVNQLIGEHGVSLEVSLNPQKRSIEVVLYGLKDQGSAVGRTLADHDCFLQRPWSHDKSVPYDNPQMLDCLASFKKYTRALNKEQNNKLDELLDSADGSTVSPEVPPCDILTTDLKRHQAKALCMMVEKESGILRGAKFPSLWVERPGFPGSASQYYNTVMKSFTAERPSLCLGGLLADDMGLGKTLTTLTLIASMPIVKRRADGIYRPTLIICPMSIIPGWQDQISRHFAKDAVHYKIYHGRNRDSEASALSGTDIVFTTYQILRSECSTKTKDDLNAKKHRRQGLLQSIDWHRVVLDEGLHFINRDLKEQIILTDELAAHEIRNRASGAYQSVVRLKARHRWCLTGTPIHNTLEDLSSLVAFLRVAPFDRPEYFRTFFIVPVNKNDGTSWERLRDLIRSITLRRTKKALKADLAIPPPRDYTELVSLDETERRDYDSLMTEFRLFSGSPKFSKNTFKLIVRLRQVCNHGRDLLPQPLRERLRRRDNGTGTLLEALFIDYCEVCDCNMEFDGVSRDSRCLHSVCSGCLLRVSGACPLCSTSTDDEAAEEDLDAYSPSSHGIVVQKTEATFYRPSSKVTALLKNLMADRDVATSSVSGPLHIKSVVFSEFTRMLDLVGIALEQAGIPFQRLDGTMNLDQRRLKLHDYRSNPDCTVLLASLKSMAVGVDLSVASRVHLLEPGWNPMLERQAFDRVHRLGQNSEVVFRRYITANSIEQHIRDRQIYKSTMVESSLNCIEPDQSSIVKSTTDVGEPDHYTPSTLNQVLTYIYKVSHWQATLALNEG